MSDNSHTQGIEGEELAKRHLQFNGYRILERNWRFGKYEIDIIASKDNTIVIVEVKTRKTDTFGEPEIFVTKQKQKFLVAAANEYIVSNNIEMETRFDIIAIIRDNNSSTVKHLEGAFYPLVK